MSERLIHTTHHDRWSIAKGIEPVSDNRCTAMSGVRIGGPDGPEIRCALASGHGSEPHRWSTDAGKTPGVSD